MTTRPPADPAPEPRLWDTRTPAVLYVPADDIETLSRCACPGCVAGREAPRTP